MTYEEMKNEIIHKYGFESTETINFFRACEAKADEGKEFYIRLLFEILMERGYDE
jgi:hypothetical protein